MGAHKGKKWADKPTKARYFSEDHRTQNKRRRISKCNGEKFLAQWDKTYGPTASSAPVAPGNRRASR